MANVEAPAFIAAADAVEGRAVREAAINALASPRWAIRVHPGEAIRLDFVAGGLARPEEATQPLTGPAEPVAEAGNAGARG